ncbi:MAG: hypothetical protein MI919_28865, partial [Holophagales bacterium]|nr:hypothetical protein [Holophagales bacterium]
VELALALAEDLRAVGIPPDDRLGEGDARRDGPGIDDTEIGDTAASIVPFPTRHRYLLAAAAAALLAVALLPSFWWASRHRDAMAQLTELRQPRVVAPGLVLSPRREALDSPAEPAPLLERRSGEPWTTLAVDLGEHPGLTLDVELRDASGATLWRGEGLETPGRGSIVLSFPSSLLAPGHHTVRLGLRASDGRVEPAGVLAFELREVP